MRRFILAIALSLGVPAAAAASVLPPGFVDELVPFVFDAPTKLAFLPDGRLLVCEKGGIVYVVKDTARTALWVREDEVLNTDERGLVSVAVDPAFATNRYLYFLYTCDPDSNGIELDNYDEAYCRLTRYQLPAADASAVDYGSRTVLIGTGWNDGWVSPSGGHNVADLEWGRDGTLMVGAGDGAHFEVLDAGGLDPGQFAPGRSDSSEDLGTFRSQSIGSQNGKLLRIDPATGHGLPSNPFWDGDSVSKRSRVWAYGLRNPFRIALRPGTGSTDPTLGDPGTFYVGDVGWSSLEEVDVVAAAGLNFGWPCYEGFGVQPDYAAAAPAASGCSTIGTPANPSFPTAPLLDVHHFDPAQSAPPGVTGATMIGGVFYGGGSYPSRFTGRYFYGDYTEGWIKCAVTNASNQLMAVADFGSDFGGIVSFAVDPLGGDLFVATIWDGLVHHIRWAGGLDVPNAQPAPRIALSAARPNPSRGAVGFSLELPAASRVGFEVLDLNGRRLWAAPASERGAGTLALLWPGRDASGARARPGVYLARVTVDGRPMVRRFALVW